jgi:hypothetical protein
MEVILTERYLRDSIKKGGEEEKQELLLIFLTM